MFSTTVFFDGFRQRFLLVFGSKSDAEMKPKWTPNRPKKVRARNPAFGGTERAGFRFHTVKHTTFPRFPRFGAAVRLHFSSILHDFFSGLASGDVWAPICNQFWLHFGDKMEQKSAKMEPKSAKMEPRRQDAGIKWA